MTYRWVLWIRLTTLALSSALCFSLSAQQADFKIITSGPHHVVRGHFMYVLVQGQVLTGTADMLGNYVVPTISGAPTGTTIEYVNLIRFCCTKSLWTVDSLNPVKISTSSTTKLGTYPLTI